MNPEKLNSIYWIGGSPCSGKSSISEMLVKKYNFYLYKCDDYMEWHMKEGKKRGYETISKISSMSFEELWMRDVLEQVNDEINYYKEEFVLLLEDLNKIDSYKDIIVEGAGLLPELLINLGIKKCKSVYVVPTPDFQIYNYRKRDWIKDILKQCSNPKIAFENWMKRDIEFEKKIINKVKKNNLNLIIVDGKNTIEENFLAIEKMLKLKLK